MNWRLKSKRFIELVHKFGGPTKNGSGDITICYRPEGIEVSLGTYDIPTLPSNSDLGLFPNENLAMQAVDGKLNFIENLLSNSPPEDEEE